MKRLNEDKLDVELRDGVTYTEPVIGKLGLYEGLQSRIIMTIKNKASVKGDFIFLHLGEAKYNTSLLVLIRMGWGTNIFTNEYAIF